jgi:predicted regulator of Ras-like GTPase activity (Roadblock/LC7/MglB family)
MVKKTQSLQEIAVSATIEEDNSFTSLRANLAKINKRKGVLGYILRNASSAIIDLKGSAKIVEYAILSSQALESSKELSALFQLGPTENILIKGKNIKALCAVIGENQVAIFMKKDADHTEILKQVSP